MGVGGFNLGLGSSGLEGMSDVLSMAQLAQLNGVNEMNPFNTNMLGMANLSAMGISPEAQLLAAQIAAAGDRFGQAGLGLGGGLGGFAGKQEWWRAAHPRQRRRCEERRRRFRPCNSGNRSVYTPRKCKASGGA